MGGEPPAARQARPGGRTARTREAVLQAAASALVELGVEGVTWDALAERSGVNRSTIYRRWGTLGGVVGDLASQFAGELEYPETGTLQGDLAYAIDQIRRMLTPENCRLVQALIAWRDAAVQDEMASFWLSRRRAIRGILRRHGLDVDVAVAVRVMAGPMYYSALIENRSPTAADAHAALVATMAWIETQTREGHR